MRKINAKFWYILLNWNILTLTACKYNFKQPPFQKPWVSTKPMPKKENALSFFQKTKQELQKQINEFNLIINEINTNKNEYDSQTEYQQSLKQTQAEQALKIAAINECDYQILCIENKNGFNKQQIQVAIALLTKKINHLNHAITLITTINDSDFELADTIKFKNDIQTTTTKLNELRTKHQHEEN